MSIKCKNDDLYELNNSINYIFYKLIFIQERTLKPIANPLQEINKIQKRRTENKFFFVGPNFCLIL